MSTDSFHFWSLNLLWFFGIRISVRTHRKDGNGAAKVAQNTARFTMSFLWVSNLFWHSFQPSLLSAAVSTVNIRTGINKCVVFKRILCSFPLFYLNMLCYALPNFEAKPKCQPLLGGRVVPDAISGVFLLATSSVATHDIYFLLWASDCALKFWFHGYCVFSGDNLPRIREHLEGRSSIDLQQL